MTYAVKQAPHEAKLIKQSQQRGFPLPKEIENAPELLETLQLYWTCFFQLRRGQDRHNPLTWRDVQYWCDTHRLGSELAQAVHNATLAMDEIWLELNPRPKSDNSSGNSSRRKGN